MVRPVALHITFRLEPESRWAYYGPFKSDNFKWLAPQASLPRKDIVQAWHTIRPRLVELDEVDIEVGFGHPWTPSTFEPILSCIGDKLEVVNPEGLVWVYPPFPAPSLFQDYYVPLVVRRAKQVCDPVDDNFVCLIELACSSAKPRPLRLRRRDPARRSPPRPQHSHP